VQVSAASATEVTAVADRIASLLRVRHKIQPGDPDDFMVRTLEEMANVRKKPRTMTALLASKPACHCSSAASASRTSCWSP
jgi:hypothetical protein